MAALRGPLLLVGCGKMGGALLRGWLRQGLPADEAAVVEPAGVPLDIAGVAACTQSSQLPAISASRIPPRPLITEPAITSERS